MIARHRPPVRIAAHGGALGQCGQRLAEGWGVRVRAGVRVRVKVG